MTSPCIMLDLQLQGGGRRRAFGRGVSPGRASVSKSEEIRRGQKMGDISRRAMLATTGLGLLGAGVATGWAKNITDGGDQQTTASHKNSGPLALSDYEPRSMLHVKETHVSRARYPAIDFHTHITESAHTVNGVALGAKRVYAATPEELLPVMDR